MANYNYYQILKIECNKNGCPLEHIDDNYIEEKYEDRLVDFFINQIQWQYVNSQLPEITRELSEKERRERKYEANRILESKESEDVRIEAENYIAKKTRGLPVLERIKIVKAEITNVAKGNDLIQPYIEAYENLSTQEKRDNYNKEIEQIDLSKKLKSNLVNVELKEIDDGFSYGDLMVERKKLPTEMLYTNYQGLMIALDKEMRYRYYRYKETEKISAIKSKAKMEHKEVLKYFILRRQNGTYSKIDSFYADEKIAEQLRKRTKNGNEIKRKAEFVKALMTSYEMVARKGKKYVGDIIETADGYQCIQNKNIEKMLQNFITKQEQSKLNKQISEQGEGQWQK